MSLRDSNGDPDSLFFDHAVLVVADLDLATRRFQELGFSVLPGGIHSGQLTHNALVPFQDGSYLELLAPFDKNQSDSLLELQRSGHLETHPSARTPLGLRFAESLVAGEGINDFALGTARLEEVVNQARERGLQVDSPATGGRLRPDGQRVSWQTGCPATRDLPFLIEDLTPRAWRVPGGASARHQNQASGIAAILMAVADLENSTARYTALLGKQPSTTSNPIYNPSDAPQSRFLVQDTFLALEPADLHANQGSARIWEAGRPRKIWLYASDEKRELQVLEYIPEQGYCLIKRAQY